MTKAKTNLCSTKSYKANNSDWSQIIHRVPKLAIILASNTYNSVCSLWISTKCWTLHYLTIIYGHTYYDRILPRVLSAMSLWRQSLY